MKTTMINIGEAKAHLSEYARRVKRGQRIILCDRKKPFAEIRPLRPALDRTEQSEPSGARYAGPFDPSV
jgi:antitoxin (DNA-binding transcriptional repressor) of toxin-antitoxin stability system